MMSQQEIYRIYLKDRFGEILISPLDFLESGLKWSNASEDALRDYELEFDGGLSLINEAFDRLLRIEKSVYRCTEQYLRIERLCTESGTNVYKEIYKGVILLNNCQWDLVNRVVEVKFKKDTEYKCLDDSSREKVNIISTLGSVQVDIFQQGVELESVECSGEVFDDGPQNLPFCGNGTASEGFYSVMESRQTWQPPQEGPSGPGNWQYRYYVKWAREVLILPCGVDADFGWSKVGNCFDNKQKWARFPSLINCSRDNTYDPITQIETLVTKCESMIVGGNTVLRNGQTLENVLKRLITAPCDFSIKSNFFQINPDQPSLINYVTGERSTTDNVIIFQKSDVKRPLDYNVATKGETNFEEFMEALFLLFNVVYRLNSGVLEIEHVSFFNKNKGLDLTGSKYNDYTTETLKYSYKNDEVPASETWRIKEGSPGGFSEQAITYPSNCVVDRSITKEYLLDGFMTDVNHCFNNPESDSSVVEDKGFVLVSARLSEGRYYINGQQSDSSVRATNGVFSIADLVRSYHFYERPLLNGQISGELVMFKSSKPIKKGEPITIPLCCETIFNANDYVVTDLGNGILDNARFDFKSQTLELDLLYNENEDLTPNTPPTTGSITKKTYIDEPIVIDMWENAHDEEGKLAGFNIKTQPTIGTVEVLNSREILYTPFASGGDYFQFTVFDEWNEESNVSSCIIEVRPENLPPVANDDYYTMFNDSPTTIPSHQGLFVNDHDDNGFTLDHYDASTTLNGAVVVQNNGGFTYTPPSGGVLGIDTFTYTIIDERGLTDTATCYITLKDRNEINTTPKVYITWENESINATGSLPNRILTYGDSTDSGLPITVLAENKATSQGGNVNINTNGTFEYMPLNGFVGADTFTYTAKTDNATKQETVMVNVVNNIYVRMETNTISNEELMDICNQVNTLVGSEVRSEDVLYFYSDPQKTIPIDVTGLGLRVEIEKDVVDLDFSYLVTAWTTVLSGFSQVVVENYQSYIQRANCDGTTNEHRTENHSLEPGQGYKF